MFDLLCVLKTENQLKIYFCSYECMWAAATRDLRLENLWMCGLIIVLGPDFWKIIWWS